MKIQGFNNSLNGEKVILICVLPKNIEGDGAASVPELRRLAETVGAIVVDVLVQRLNNPDPATYLGKGGVQTLVERLGVTGSKNILCLHDVRPGQVKNIEKATGANFFTRTELILYIFSQHAKTKQARLQVDLATLKYELPRLKGMWEHLSRQRGVIGVRSGFGEKQIEIDRRNILKEIKILKDKLNAIRQRRIQQINRRAHFSVALVGYTNVGKSTLFNLLTNENKPSEDMYFNTLDTSSRKWCLGSSQEVILTDTVGFIRDLPHDLIESFHATLEEVLKADFILHIIDCSDPQKDFHASIVEDTLLAIGANEISRISVYSKSDLLTNPETTGQSTPSGIFTSSKTGEGISLLSACIAKAIRKRRQLITVKLESHESQSIAWLHENSEIVEEEYLQDGVQIRSWIEQENLGRLIQKVDSSRIRKEGENE